MKRIYSDSQLQECYERGYDSAISGEDMVNCNFSLFSSPDRKDAWERGRKDGKRKSKEGENI